jgi:hypothetical protein
MRRQRLQLTPLIPCPRREGCDVRHQSFERRCRFLCKRGGHPSCNLKIDSKVLQKHSQRDVGIHHHEDGVPQVCFASTKRAARMKTHLTSKRVSSQRFLHLGITHLPMQNRYSFSTRFYETQQGLLGGGLDPYLLLSPTIPVPRRLRRPVPNVNAIESPCP